MTKSHENIPSIESRGRQMADELSRRMRSGEEASYKYIKLKHEHLLKLPRLVPEPEFAKRERFQEDLRYDPETGAIYTSRWREINNYHPAPSGRRSVKNPENYTFLSSTFYTPAPEDLPRTGKVVELIISRVWDGLEPAIRQQLHILAKFDSVNLDTEPQALRKIVYWITQASQVLKEGPVSRSKLNQMSSEATEMLTSFAQSPAAHETKEKVAQMLTKAAQPDSRGRINPMISRIRLRSALLNSTRRLVTSDLIRRKFSANLEVLIAEREFTRYSLDQAYAELNSVSETVSLLETNPSQVLKSEKQILSAQISEISKHYLKFPKVAPYLLPARLAGLYLAGVNEAEKDITLRILGDGAEEEIANPSASKLLLSENEVDLKTAGSQIRWARSIISEVLNLEEYKDILVDKSS